MAASSKEPPARSAGRKPPKLLSGGNPQIAKGYGDAPVQAYIEAIPDWKQPIARRIDQWVTRAIPTVRKAVKYNSPIYGAAERDDWFLSIHCFSNYLKVAFFRGASLDPPPPGPSKQKHVRYLDIRQGDTVDQRLFFTWVKQASRLPGEKM